MDNVQDKDDMIKKLVDLVHLDIDAVHAYDHAIQKIDPQEIKSQIQIFKNDHERHVEDLSACIRRYGGEAPEFKPDFKGYFIEGMTALRSVTGTEGALKAMKTNEELTNKKYDEAFSLNLPPDVSMIIQRNRDDEKRHLQYITNCIEQKLYDKEQAA